MFQYWLGGLKRRGPAEYGKASETDDLGRNFHWMLAGGMIRIMARMRRVLRTISSRWTNMTRRKSNNRKVCKTYDSGRNFHWPFGPHTCHVNGWPRRVLRTISDLNIAIQSFLMRGIRIWAQNPHAECSLHGNINFQNFGLHGDATSDFVSQISFLVWKIWTPNLCQTSPFYFL